MSSPGGEKGKRGEKWLGGSQEERERETEERKRRRRRKTIITITTLKTLSREIYSLCTQIEFENDKIKKK